MSQPVLWLEGITARFGRREVLRDVDLELGKGVHGLLGPNGAGKSTLFGILAGVFRPAAGTIMLGEHRCGLAADKEMRKRVGYLPQRFDLSGTMTVVATVEFAAWANGINDNECRTAAERALAVVGLSDFGKRRVRTMSGGERQRLGIACAVAHAPDLLLLDEPTVGLDPVQRAQVRGYLRTIGERATVLISTHMVEDLAQIADLVTVLVDGRIAFRGTVQELSDCGGVTDQFVSPLEAGYRAVSMAVRA